MKHYLAPMEGITTYIYRNAYHRHYSPMDKYFTPFLVPHTKKGFSTRELREICPEHNEGLFVVPQIMSNEAKGCVKTIEKLKKYGYEEINLNMGCPSKTVVSKYRGSGFLAKPEELDHFLERLFADTDIRISVKTRIGRDCPEEFMQILEIYNRYPLTELIIHPRVQQDFYKNHPNQEVYGYAAKRSRNPLCYNGDIYTMEDYRLISQTFPETEAVMMGRGILSNPELLEEKRGVDKERLRAFHDEIYAGYQELSMGERNVLFKMKELWTYMIRMFPDGEKLGKKLKKTEGQESYRAVVDELFTLLS